MVVFVFDRILGPSRTYNAQDSGAILYEAEYPAATTVTTASLPPPRISSNDASQQHYCVCLLSLYSQFQESIFFKEPGEFPRESTGRSVSRSA